MRHPTIFYLDVDTNDLASFGCPVVPFPQLTLLPATLSPGHYIFGSEPYQDIYVRHYFYSQFSILNNRSTNREM